MKKFGTTRTVWLIGKYAFKFPHCYSWKTFLWGLQGNMQERELDTLKHEALCPVLFYIPGGFLVVMPRAEPIPDDYSIGDFFEKYKEDSLPVEKKRDSFGVLNGKIVAVDYGT